MIPLFNADMGQRIADLWKAVESGAEVSCRFLPEAKWEGGWISDRIVATIPDTGRELVFALPMAQAIADQFEANDHPVFADRLRPDLETDR